MSTRCRLGYKDRESGLYVTVYRHCDGYVEGAGLDMWNNYPTYDKVSKKLLKDYEEDWIEKFETLDAILEYFKNSDLEYIYIFEDDDKWYCAESTGYDRETMKKLIKNFKPLTELFDENGIEASTSDEHATKLNEIRASLDVIKNAIADIEKILN